MIPIVQIEINNASNLGFTAFFNMIIDGRLNVVTAIIKERIVPNWAPFTKVLLQQELYQICQHT